MNLVQSGVSTRDDASEWQMISDPSRHIYSYSMHSIKTNSDLDDVYIQDPKLYVGEYVKEQ
jgi:hypothetical protein